MLDVSLPTEDQEMTLLSQSCVGCGAPLKSAGPCEYCGRVYKDDTPAERVVVNPSGALRQEYVYVQNFYAGPPPPKAQRRSNIAAMDAGVRIYSGGLGWLLGLKNHRGRLEED